MNNEASRRDFLFSSSLSGLLILEPRTVFGSEANSAIEIGIVGAGARGAYIGNFFTEQTGARIVALADPLPDRIASLKNSLGCAQAREYSNLDGFRDLVRSKLDAVVVESPPYFHPAHVEAAVAAGKHVFLAKPVAVDVPGCTSIAESAQRADGKVSFVVDFQTRARPAFQEAAARLFRGEIGQPVLVHAYYHSDPHLPQHVAGDSPLQDRLRNWNLSQALSGDIIVEQDIHAIDTAVWYMQAHPVEAWGACNRTPQPGEGDMQDVFVVSFSFPNGVRADFSGARFVKGYRDICVRVYGTSGTLDSHYLGAVRITGDHPWTGATADATREGALANVRAFVESIRTGKLLNNAASAVESNLACILGRTAAYENRVVTWEEMAGRNEKLDARLPV
jgi:predicted dehydrogenase